MNILDRIKQLSDNENIKITQLEDKIGASKGVLSRALRNNTDIQSKWISMIVENYPQYSSKWLLTGKGEMICNNENIDEVTEPEEAYTKKHHNNEIYKLQLEYIEKLSAEKALLEHENKILREQLEKCKK